MRYGLNTKRLCRTLHTVVFDIDSSFPAVSVDFFGLCRKLARTRLTSSSAVNGRPLDFWLHRHPVSVNCLYHPRMVLSVGGSIAYFVRNAHCTVTTDLLVWYSNTQNDFSPGVAIFSHYIHSYRLAAEMWTAMKNNLLGKNILNCSFYLYRFRKYVSYGFPIIHFYNPRVHYETSCILLIPFNGITDEIKFFSLLSILITWRVS